MKSSPDSNDIVDMSQQVADLVKGHEYFSRLVECEPQNSQAWYQFGAVQQMAGQFAQAETSYRQALLIDANHAKAHSALGILYLQSGKEQAALESFKNSLRCLPDEELAKMVDALQACRESTVPVVLELDGESLELDVTVKGTVSEQLGRKY